MAKMEKFDTLEQVAEAMGVPVTDQNRKYLEQFVKKALSENAGAKKKELVEQAAFFGLTGLKEEEENVLTLQIKIITHLFENGRFDEMNEFAGKHHLLVTPEGKIHRLKQTAKAIEDRNAGTKEGTVGFNTIQVLKNAEFAGLTAAEVAEKVQELFGQKTTAPSVQWYINYVGKKLEKAVAAKADYINGGGEDTAKIAEYDKEIEFFTVAKRSRTGKAAKSESGVALGAELTMEKARQPRGFQAKKKDKPEAGGADLGSELNLDDAAGKSEEEIAAEEIAAEAAAEGTEVSEEVAGE